MSSSADAFPSLNGTSFVYETADHSGTMSDRSCGHGEPHNSAAAAAVAVEAEAATPPPSNMRGAPIQLASAAVSAHSSKAPSASSSLAASRQGSVQSSPRMHSQPMQRTHEQQHQQHVAAANEAAIEAVAAAQAALRSSQSSAAASRRSSMTTQQPQQPHQQSHQASAQPTPLPEPQPTAAAPMNGSYSGERLRALLASTTAQLAQPRSTAGVTHAAPASPARPTSLANGPATTPHTRPASLWSSPAAAALASWRANPAPMYAAPSSAVTVASRPVTAAPYTAPAKNEQLHQQLQQQHHQQQQQPYQLSSASPTASTTAVSSWVSPSASPIAAAARYASAQQALSPSKLQHASSIHSAYPLSPVNAARRPEAATPALHLTIEHAIHVPLLPVPLGTPMHPAAAAGLTSSSSSSSRLALPNTYVSFMLQTSSTRFDRNVLLADSDPAAAAQRQLDFASPTRAAYDVYASAPLSAIAGPVPDGCTPLVPASVCPKWNWTRSIPLSQLLPELGALSPHATEAEAAQMQRLANVAFMVQLWHRPSSSIGGPISAGPLSPSSRPGGNPAASPPVAKGELVPASRDELLGSALVTLHSLVSPLASAIPLSTHQAWYPLMGSPTRSAIQLSVALTPNVALRSMIQRYAAQQRLGTLPAQQPQTLLQSPPRQMLEEAHDDREARVQERLHMSASLRHAAELGSPRQTAAQQQLLLLSPHQAERANLRAHVARLEEELAHRANLDAHAVAVANAQAYLPASASAAASSASPPATPTSHAHTQRQLEYDMASEQPSRSTSKARRKHKASGDKPQEQKRSKSKNGRTKQRHGAAARSSSSGSSSSASSVSVDSEDNSDRTRSRSITPPRSQRRGRSRSRTRTTKDSARRHSRVRSDSSSDRSRSRSRSRSRTPSKERRRVRPSEHHEASPPSSSRHRSAQKPNHRHAARVSQSQPSSEHHTPRNSQHPHHPASSRSQRSRRHEDRNASPPRGAQFEAEFAASATDYSSSDDIADSTPVEYPPPHLLALGLPQPRAVVGSSPMDPSGYFRDNPSLRPVELSDVDTGDEDEEHDTEDEQAKRDAEIAYQLHQQRAQVEMRSPPRSSRKQSSLHSPAHSARRHASPGRVLSYAESSPAASYRSAHRSPPRHSPSRHSAVPTHSVLIDGALAASADFVGSPTSPPSSSSRPLFVSPAPAHALSSVCRSFGMDALRRNLQELEDVNDSLQRRYLSKERATAEQKQEQQQLPPQPQCQHQQDFQSRAPLSAAIVEQQQQQQQQPEVMDASASRRSSVERRAAASTAALDSSRAREPAPTVATPEAAASPHPEASSSPVQPTVITISSPGSSTSLRSGVVIPPLVFPSQAATAAEVVAPSSSSSSAVSPVAAPLVASPGSSRSSSRSSLASSDRSTARRRSRRSGDISGAKEAALEAQIRALTVALEDAKKAAIAQATAQGQAQLLLQQQVQALMAKSAFNAAGPPAAVVPDASHPAAVPGSSSPTLSHAASVRIPASDHRAQSEGNLASSVAPAAAPAAAPAMMHSRSDVDAHAAVAATGARPAEMSQHDRERLEVQRVQSFALWQQAKQQREKQGRALSPLPPSPAPPVAVGSSQHPQLLQPAMSPASMPVVRMAPNHASSSPSISALGPPAIGVEALESTRSRSSDSGGFSAMTSPISRMESGGSEQPEFSAHVLPAGTNAEDAADADADADAGASDDDVAFTSADEQPHESSPPKQGAPTRTSLGMMRADRSAAAAAESVDRSDSTLLLDGDLAAREDRRPDARRKTSGLRNSELAELGPNMRRLSPTHSEVNSAASEAEAEEDDGSEEDATTRSDSQHSSDTEEIEELEYDATHGLRPAGAAAPARSHHPPPSPAESSMHGEKALATLSKFLSLPLQSPGGFAAPAGTGNGLLMPLTPVTEEELSASPPALAAPAAASSKLSPAVSPMMSGARFAWQRAAAAASAYRKQHPLPNKTLANARGSREHPFSTVLATSPFATAHPHAPLTVADSVLSPLSAAEAERVAQEAERQCLEGAQAHSSPEVVAAVIDNVLHPSHTPVIIETAQVGGAHASSHHRASSPVDEDGPQTSATAPITAADLAELQAAVAALESSRKTREAQQAEDWTRMFESKYQERQQRAAAHNKKRGNQARKQLTAASKMARSISQPAQLVSAHTLICCATPIESCLRSVDTMCLSCSLAGLLIFCVVLFSDDSARTLERHQRG